MRANTFHCFSLHRLDTFCWCWLCCLGRLFGLPYVFPVFFCAQSVRPRYQSMTSIAYLHDCHCCHNERSFVEKKKLSGSAKGLRRLTHGTPSDTHIQKRAKVEPKPTEEQPVEEKKEKSCQDCSDSESCCLQASSVPPWLKRLGSKTQVFEHYKRS